MENEEIEDLIKKNTFEDQMASSWLKFCQCNLLLVQVWSSLFILSLYHSLGHLRFSWRTLVWSKGKGRQGKERKRK